MEKVGIVDYGMGNILSVRHALEAVGAEVTICRSPNELDSVHRIVLPGVGAFRDCIDTLREKGFAERLQKEAIERGKPTLGICLGMQVMAERGFEDGEHRGLGWFPADVERLRPADKTLRIPHIGWNELKARTTHSLWQGIPADANFYFVHSFAVRSRDPQTIAATCDYGGEFVAAIRHRNLFGTQFHPEKSQDHGLALLQNFIDWQGAD